MTRKQTITDLCPFELLHFLHCCEIVDCCVLDDRQENKQEAGPQVNVNSFDIRHLWHRGGHSRDNGGHGQDCGDAWKQNVHIQLLYQNCC